MLLQQTPTLRSVASPAPQTRPNLPVEGAKRQGLGRNQFTNHDGSMPATGPPTAKWNTVYAPSLFPVTVSENPVSLLYTLRPLRASLYFLQFRPSNTYIRLPRLILISLVFSYLVTGQLICLFPPPLLFPFFFCRSSTRLSLGSSVEMFLFLGTSYALKESFVLKQKLP